jgi:hypothetical protein
MARTFRTLVQSIISPVISTVLYFIVFGAAIGSGIQTIDNIHCSGANNAHCANAKRCKRLFWHLFSQISWNNL